MLTKTEIEELERWISNSIELQPAKQAFTKPPGALTDGGAWVYTSDSYEKEHGEQTRPRSWATDETANAMLLEMMPLGVSQNCGDWWGWGGAFCRAGQERVWFYHMFRKVAVCLAFQAWRRGEK